VSGCDKSFGEMLDGNIYKYNLCKLVEGLSYMLGLVESMLEVLCEKLW
jgi:hypothetical protein